MSGDARRPSPPTVSADLMELGEGICGRLFAEGAAEGWALLEAEKHRPEPGESYCACGFCVWSVEHVVVMVLRSMFEHRIVRPHASAGSEEER